MNQTTNQQGKKPQRPFSARMTQQEINGTKGKEDLQKRTRFGKSFDLSKNMHQAVLFHDPVHYLDKENGQWQEINNTLIAKTDVAGETFLTNMANDELNVELHGSNQQAMVLLQDEKGNILSWCIKDANETYPMTVQTPLFEEDTFRKNVLKNVESKAIYKDVFQGVDLTCTVQGLSFKDELIFTSAEHVRPITFRVAVPSLAIAKNEMGEITCSDAQGEAIFTLPPAFAMDQEGSHAFGKVTTTIASTDEKDVYDLTYVMDEEWLCDACFPVVLDPAVITKKHSSSIEDNYITSKYPSSVQDYASGAMRVSQGSGTWGTSKTFLRFLDSGLPPIDSSYYVTKAQLNVRTTQSGSYGLSSGNNPTSAASLYLKEVLSNWNSSSITYNNAPQVSAMPLDYVYIAKGDDNQWFTFDISNLVRKWYAGTNYGVCLDVNTNAWINLNSSDHAYYKPYVTINYVSLAGVEDYLVYDEQNVGRGGTGQVSLYNGNLIFSRQDTACGGNRMPVRVSHIYNSCYRNVDSFGTGKGWKTNMHQTLHKEVLEDEDGDTTYYVYMDADGTRHHFKQYQGEWKDQSGKGMTLTLQSSTATIEDKGHNKMVFGLPSTLFNNNYANVKMIRSLSDALGNTMTVTASGNVISNVEDGVGRNTGFSNSSGRLSTLYPPGYGESGYCGFTYNANGQMVTAWELAGTGGSEEMVYTYDSRGLLTSVTNCDGLKVTYTYYTQREPYRVQSVTIGKDALTIYDRSYQYKDCLTVVTDNLSGKKLFYHFNDYGNCVSVNDELGHACFAKYSDDNPVNHPQTLSKLQRSVQNLLKNHNFETDSDWGFTNGFPGNTIEYSTQSPYMGSRCVKTTVVNGIRCDMQQWVTLERGKTYTFSCYAKCTGDMRVWLETYTADEGWTVFPQSEVQSVSEYVRYHKSFTVPGENGSLNVYIGIRMGSGNGTAWVDCAQLEEGVVPNRYNMLLNGDFTFNSNAHPTAWLKNSSNTSVDKVYTTCTGTKPEGLSQNTMRLYGTGRTKYAGIYQDIKQSGSEGDVFVAGGWSFNYSKPRKGEDHRYNIRVAFLKAGTSSTRVNTDSIEWSEEWSDWQFAAGPVVAPCDYTAIRFNVDYERNINYAEFNGLFLHKEEFGQSYVYDEEGNVLSSKNAAGTKDGATYDAFDNVLTYFSPGRPSSVKTTLEWGTTDAEKKKHLLRKSTSPLGIINEYSYDAYGNVTTSKVKNGNVFMQTDVEYSANGNHTTQKTDTRGKVVTQVVNSSLDTLSTLTDPRGQTVHYTYDNNKRITKTMATVNGQDYQNNYVYEDDKLAYVKHNTGVDNTGEVSYHFNYDEAGRPTQVKVGSQALSTTSYNPTGTVNQVTL